MMTRTKFMYFLKVQYIFLKQFSEFCFAIICTVIPLDTVMRQRRTKTVKPVSGIKYIYLPIIGEISLSLKPANRLMQSESKLAAVMVSWRTARTVILTHLYSHFREVIVGSYA